jgi:hypothetical protein
VEGTFMGGTNFPTPSYQAIRDSSGGNTNIKLMAGNVISSGIELKPIISACE